MKEFDFKDVQAILEQAWNKFIANWKPLCISSLIGYFLPFLIFFVLEFGILMSLSSLAQYAHDNQMTFGSLIGFGVFFLIIECVVILYSVGIINYCIKLCRGENPLPKDFFLPISIYLKLIASFFLIFIACCIGMVFCVLPMFIVLFFTALVNYIIIDHKDFGVIDSIKYSCKLIKQNWKIALVTLLILYALNFLIANTIVGMVPMLPFSTLVTTLLYFKLEEAPTATEPQNEMPPTIQS